ncbi:hypothetical protein HPB52_012211 [Rhipicephalus sanguineus]|uniref:Endothelin-converting enzyme 1 n=1 Tax=Rhipicephalus sanguineus TaxID=34632 RepID=A0A9D4YNQ1_RHISA|nr:hypothetical protein HPB52_012211 [Rhipicephalus sanguineus]
MQNQKQTVEPAKITDAAGDKGIEGGDPSEASEMSSVGHGPATDEEETGRRTAGLASRKKALEAYRGRVKRRVRYERLTDCGKVAVGAEPGSAIRRPAATSEGSKETSDKGQRRSEGPSREKSGTQTSDGRRDAPDSLPSSERELLEDPEFGAMQLAHDQLFDLDLFDQDRRATRDPRSVSDLSTDVGSSSMSAGGSRKGGYSTETTGLTRLSQYRAVLVVVLCMAFVVIALLVVRLVAKGNPQSFFAPAAWVKEMDVHCNSPDCVTATKFITTSMDVSTNPCTDFYAFACGRWRSTAPVGNEEPEWASSAGRNVSYVASLRSDYVAAANDSLLRVVQASATNDEQVTHMGQVYTSCLSFFVDKPLNLTTAWQAANIYTNLWLEAKTFQDSLFLAVTHLLHYRFGSVFDVSCDARVVDISPGTAILRHVNAGFRRAIVMRAAKALLSNNSASVRQRSDVLDYTTSDSGAFGKMVDAIVNLDDVVFNQTAASTLPPVEIALNELDSTKWNWTELFAAQYSVEATALPIKARVTNVDGVTAILNLLSSQEDMMTTKIYLMLVPLAKFFGMEERARVHRRVPRDDIINELCVTALETMFGDFYRRWITTELAGSDTGDELRRMLSGVLTAADKVLEVTKGFVLDYGTMAAVTNPTKMYPLNNATIPTVEANYGSDFVANAILFMAGGGTSTRPLLDFGAVSVDWSDREVVQRLLIPDFYYAHTDQVVLNYGTMGYYLARHAFWAGSPWHVSRNDSHGTTSPVARNLTVLTHCLAAYVKNVSGIELSVDEPWWREVVQTRWAAEVSFRAAAFRDANIARQRSLKQLFFLRFGHTFCAMPSRGQRDVAATACRVAAMTLPAFAGAFKCPVVVGMAC